jgi:hypothetical protein
MTPIEIRAAIAADPALLALVPDTQAIADAMSAGRTKVTQKLGGVGLVLETLGPDAGSALLDGLDALKAVSSPVKWAWVLIDRGELDFGSPATRGMIQQLAAGGAIPEPAATALLAIAEVPDPIDEMSVGRAIFNDDGSLAL